MRRVRIKIVTLAALVAILVTSVAASCSTTRVRPPLMDALQIDQLPTRASIDPRSAEPTVGLVMGGGGLKGLAHIGVLRALEEAGIRPDMVVGTSAGALVGAAYASGMDSRAIQSVARDVDIPSFIDFALSSGGIMRGDNISDWVEGITGGVPIEAFPTRYAAVATDLRLGKAVVLDRGSPGEAVRASAAVPGVTVPVEYRHGHLVDGGVASLVPVRAAKAMGADIVIAVDVYCNDKSSAGVGAATVVRQVMRTQSCLIAAAELAEADIVIAPMVPMPGISNKSQQQEAIDAGYLAARLALSQSPLAADLHKRKHTIGMQ